MEAQPEQPAEKIKRLQRCINDLVSILALPAMWSGVEPPQIVRTLLEVLLDMVRLDLVYVRLEDLAGKAPIEMARVAQPRSPTVGAQEIGALLNQCLGEDPRKWPSLARNRFGDGDISIVPLRLGLQGEIGVIIAGSQRLDFPGQTERLLLEVAANQAAIALQEARHLSEQKRLANELDQRVAQRTKELAEAIDELQLRVSMLQHIPVAAWTVTPDGTPDIVNQSWFDYTDQTPEFVNSAPEAWMSTLHPEDRERASQSYWGGIRSGQGFTMEARFLRARDGTYRWHLNRAVALRDAEGKILRFVGTSTDIEDLKQAEKKLRESKLNLRQLTETIPEMLWSATAEGAIDYCNTRLLDYTGFSAEEIMGAGWTKLLHPDDIDQAARMWMSSVATGDPYRVEVRTFHAADRNYRWCVTNALPLLDQQRHILKWHGTVVDMHDWKQAQEELRKAQANLARISRLTTVGELTASIAHEVNQPLAAVVTNANACLRWLDHEPPNIEEVRIAIRRIMRDGNRGGDVITRIRGLVKKEHAPRARLDVNEVVRETIALVQMDLQGTVLRTELEGGLPLVQADRVQLQQVLLNLMMNAMDAMRPVTDRPHVLRIQTKYHEERAVLVAVQDSGVGLNPEGMEKLFETFYTTKPEGLGMGLSICRSIIEGHGGRLWAESKEGSGATFQFTLPIESEGPA